MSFNSIGDYRIFDIQKGMHLLFFSEDPSLFYIDSLVKDILSLGDISYDKNILFKKFKGKYNVKDIENALTELSIVRKRGFLKNKKIKVRPPDPKRKKTFRSLELHLSNDCNLSCRYCFAKGGSYGLALKNKNMKWVTAHKTLDWFFKQRGNDNDNEVSIQFFGGEPLLNLDVLERCLKYIDKKQNGFVEKSIGTNGTLFSKKAIEVLKRHNCITWVSLDSSPLSHNRNRSYKDGRPSFKNVVDGIRRLKRIAPDLPVIICTTLSQGDNMDNVIAWQKELGVDQVKVRTLFSLYDNKCAKTKEFDNLLGHIRRGLESLQSSCVAKNRPFEYLVPPVFYQLHSGKESLVGCGAGLDRIAVNVDGDVFPCSTSISPHTRLGNVSDSLEIMVRKKSRDFYRNFRKQSQGCADCWSKTLCVGPCPLHSHKGSAKPGVNRVCDLIRLTNEFYLKSYASMGYSEAIKMIGQHESTSAVLKKIDFIYKVRDLRNVNMRHIRHLTPILSD